MSAGRICDRPWYPDRVGRWLVTVDAREKVNDAWSVYTCHGGYDRASAPEM